MPRRSVNKRDQGERLRGEERPPNFTGKRGSAKTSLVEAIRADNSHLMTRVEDYREEPHLGGGKEKKQSEKGRSSR